MQHLWAFVKCFDEKNAMLTFCSCSHGKKQRNANICILIILNFSDKINLFRKKTKKTWTNRISCVWFYWANNTTRQPRLECCCCVLCCRNTGDLLHDGLLADKQAKTTICKVQRQKYLPSFLGRLDCILSNGYSPMVTFSGRTSRSILVLIWRSISSLP